MKIEMRPRVSFYSHHVRGIGHYVRTRQLIEALEGYDLFYLNGGRELSNYSNPDYVTIRTLPNFDEGGISTDSPIYSNIITQRQQIIHSTFEEVNPDVFIIEFFPFGRWYLRDELLPTLHTIKLSKQSRTHVICSLRDIPTEKTRYTKSYMMRCSTVLNTYFDHLFVHADPEFCEVKEFFTSWHHIDIEIYYTGYVSQKKSWSQNDTGFLPAHINLSPDERVILITAGSGINSYGTPDFLRNCIEAKKYLDKNLKSKFIVFCGEFLSSASFNELRAYCQGTKDIIVHRFTPNLLEWMEIADLSISRAGYNTCMNILEKRVKAILVPAKIAEDQELRAEKFANMRFATKIDEQKLSPEILAKEIQKSLCRKPVAYNIQLNGAFKTAQFLSEIIKTKK